MHYDTTLHYNEDNVTAVVAAASGKSKVTFRIDILSTYAGDWCEPLIFGIICVNFEFIGTYSNVAAAMTEKFKVVISGVSGRFPESNDIATFKEKLYNGDDFVTIDDRIWPVGWRHKMFLEKMIPDATGKRIDNRSDYTVFKMNTTHGLSSDNTNRIVLEPSFEAIVDAGVNPYSLAGRNIAVFMSAAVGEADPHIDDPNIPSDILCVIGSSRTMMSNRLSFTLNLTGPSLTQYVDSHGGLNAMDMGYKYVSEGLAEAAIVGVASSILDPRFSLQLFPLGLLSPDGVTRPFDKLARGSARSEATVCFYIQRAEDAKRSYGELLFCDSFYFGSILSSFVNYDEEYLKTILRYLYDMNNFSSKLSDIAFVEMNAYGHKLNDKSESNAVADVLRRERENPLLVGSIKSNIGHTEAAAGLMGLLKAIFALDSGTAAPNIHLQNLNYDIRAFKENQLQVVTEETSVPGCVIAVNSISMGGNVGLAVIKGNEKFADGKSCDEPFPRIALICGREEHSLQVKLTQIEKLSSSPHFVTLLNDAFGQNMPLHTYRGFTILPTPFKPIHDLGERGESNRPVWFIFSGMGSQWNGMGKSLLNLPLFAEVVSKCNQVLKGKNIDIYNILTSDDPMLFDDITNAFVGIITVQIGLFEIMKALGIKPAGIIGHSVGENACAYADGCLSLEQAVLASWARGMASKEVKVIKGMMAAVGMGYADAKHILPDDIEVACHNSANSCTLTGPAESMNSFVQKLQSEDIFARAVNVSNIAYHSKYIAPAGPKLLQRLKQVIHEGKRRSAKWVSTSVPESKWDTPLARYCSAEYLTNNLLSPVLFEEGCKHIPKNAICIEFAPHGLLQAILNRSFPDTCTNIPLTNRTKTKENLTFLLAAIGKLYIAGLEPRVNNIFPKLEYPAPRGTPSIAPYCTWYHQEESVPYHLKVHVQQISMGSEPIPICIREDSDYAFLEGHRIDDNIIIPPSFFMCLAWKMVAYKRMENFESLTATFENIKIHKQVTIRLQDIRYAFVETLPYGTGNFGVILREKEDSVEYETILTGHLNLTSEGGAVHHCKPSNRHKNSLTSSQFYDVYNQAGYRLGKEFALVQEINRRDSEYEANITWNGNWVTFIDALMKVQMFADNHGNVRNIFPNRVRMVKIPGPELSSLKNGTSLLCKVDTKVKKLLCSYASMYNLKYRPLVKPAKSLREFRFVPFENPRCGNVLEFLKFCLQVVWEINLASNEGDVNKLLVRDITSKTEYLHTIQDIIREELTLQDVEVLHSARESENMNDFILTITDVLGDRELTKLSTSTRNELILIVLPFTIQRGAEIPKHFVEVTSQSFSDKTFTLLKNIQSCSEVSKRQSVRFPSQTGKASMTKEDGSEKYFDVRKNIEFEDISRIVHKKEGCSDIRHRLYIMDEITNKQKLDELLKKQMDINLPISVLKQEEWGAYRNLTGRIYLEDKNKQFKSAQWLLNFRAAKINHICLDSGAIKNVDVLEKGTCFAYSICIKETKNRMGLGSVISTPGRPEFDPNLFWTVPSAWSSTDAVMVSYVYSQAYNILFPPHLPGHAECVLINVGNEYSLAEALTSLSLYRKLKVFLTVKTDEEAILFRNRFPTLRPHQMLCSRDYEIQIRRETKMNGVDLVINCLRGIDHVNASLRCVKKFGIYYEIGSHNCLESLDLGLYDFLKCISLCVVKNGLSNLLKLSVESKKKVKMAIEEFISRGVIVPLQIRQRSTTLKIVNCQSSEQPEASHILKYDETHSYMIVGADTKNNFWPETMEWLISRGARKFIVCLEKHAICARTSHQLNRLLAEKNVKILLVSASKLDNRREASSIVMETEKLGPLGGIFFEAIKAVGRKITNLDDVVSPDVPFVGLSSGGLKQFEQRRSRGSAAILIHSDKPRDALTVLPHLNEVLSRGENNNNTAVLYNVDGPHPQRKRRSSPHVNDYLPQSIETLSVIGQDIKSEDFTFIENSYLSKRLYECKNVYPIFVLPAIHKIMLEPLCQQLLYPVFTATIPSIYSIEDAARRLYKSLHDVQPSGPVTLISETWNLPVTLEMVSYLQSANRKYKIFVLEGNPQNWMNQISSDVPDSSLGDIIFHFNVKGKSITADTISFENKIESYARNASSDSEMVENMIRAAKRIRGKITTAKLQFSTTSQLGLLKNTFLIERRRPHDRTFNLSVSSQMVIFDVSTYDSLLNDPELSRIINENAEFSL